MPVYRKPETSIRTAGTPMSEGPTMERGYVPERPSQKKQYDQFDFPQAGDELLASEIEQASRRPQVHGYRRQPVSNGCSVTSRMLWFVVLLWSMLAAFLCWYNYRMCTAGGNKVEYFQYTLLVGGSVVVAVLAAHAWDRITS